MTVNVKYTVERERNANGRFTPVYPFAKIKLGKKFLFEISREEDDYAQEYSRLRAAAYAYYKRTGHKFQCRQVDGGIEVTRTQ